MDRNFGGVIWTNHALERLKERGIKQSDALATWKSPDQSRPATARNAWIYYKTYGNEKLEVVASKNERGQWVILTVWSRPIWEQGRQRSSSFWDNLLEGILSFLFGWLKKK
jgi:hypothetical protein